MNSSQRIATFIAAAGFLLSILFHSPWTGYETQRYLPGLFSGPGTFLDIGFLEYQTREPLLPWFASIQNFLVACLFVAILYAMFLWLFRSKDSAVPPASEA